MPQFFDTHDGATGALYDVAAVFSVVLDGPTKYGFKDATDHGQEDTIWSDMLHPTSKMHQIIAKEFVNVLENSPL